MQRETLHRAAMALVAAALLILQAVATASANETMQRADGGFVAPPPKAGFSYPDCYCTDSDGARVEMGEVACLRIGSRTVTARCGMSQNSPAWRTEAEGCPTS